MAKQTVVASDQRKRIPAALIGGTVHCPTCGEDETTVPYEEAGWRSGVRTINNDDYLEIGEYRESLGHSGEDESRAECASCDQKLDISVDALIVYDAPERVREVCDKCKSPK